MNLPVLVPEGWRDYELLDSGDGAKLERWGRYTLARPEPAALWRPALGEAEWSRADAVFERDSGDSGQWRTRRDFREPWPVTWNGLTALARLTPFRHTGVFPEQASHWRWLGDRLAGAEGVRVLNLFGYTGLATLAATAAGANVVHVDASKKAIGWARENAAASGLADRPVRWILDDAVKFVRRELRRGSRYEGIVLDPPAFGRGPSGEIWRFEEHTPELLHLCAGLLSERPRFVVITAYAVTASALALRNLLVGETANAGGAVEAGELALRERAGGRLLPTAIYARWSPL